MNSEIFRPSQTASLCGTLEHLYQCYQNDYLEMDPLELVRRFPHPQDQEIAAFIAAGLAIGQVSLIRQAVRRILECMQPSPYRFIMNFDPERHQGLFQGFRYRFYRDNDVGLLMGWLAQMVRRKGSIRAFFLQSYSASDPDIGNSLVRFVDSVIALKTTPFYKKVPRKGSGIRHFLASPRDGSGCKRLNLFLRWMVRKDNIDLGLWPEVTASQLIIPLDTHIARLGRFLGFTRRSSVDWTMALEITDALRACDPEDPVKYDFAICTLGKLSDCSKKPDPEKCPSCPVFRHCKTAAVIC